MEKTHYESMVSEPRFQMHKAFSILDASMDTDNPTWEGFSQTEVIQEALKMPYDAKDVMSTNQMLFHMYAYHKGLGRTYEVHPDIADMLLNTKLDVDTVLVKSPFPEIVINVPTGLLEVFNDRTGMHSIYTIYVNFQEESPTNKMLRVLLVGKANENSMHQYDDGFYYFRVPLKEGKISTCLDECLEKWKDDPLQKTFGSQNDTNLVPRAYQFVLNILLYITSSESDIRVEKAQYDVMSKRLEGLKSKGKIQKLQKRLAKESQINRYVIGSSINLTPEERELYKSLRSGNRHQIRYPVGGHWRAQWYGPKEASYQKPKWIRPHFRGPEIAELIKSKGVLKS